MPTVHLLDYVAGNVRSLVNAINKVGYEVEWVRSPSDLKNAEVSSWSALVMRVSCSADFSVIETYIAWGWSLRPLPLSAFRRRLFGTHQGTYRLGETVHGYLCWTAGALRRL